jgi:hypothetical protein
MEQENKYSSSDSSQNRILHFNSHNGPVSIDIDKVLFFNAYGSCSKAYLEGSKKVKSVGRELCHIEKLLKSKGEKFLRCHHCWLVNVNKIEACFKKDRLLIILSYGIQVSVRRWRDTTWVISDNDIEIIKEVGPEIKILRPFYKNNEQKSNNPDQTDAKNIRQL